MSLSNKKCAKFNNEYEIIHASDLYHLWTSLPIAVIVEIPQRTANITPIMNAAYIF